MDAFYPRTTFSLHRLAGAALVALSLVGGTAGFAAEPTLGETAQSRSAQPLLAQSLDTGPLSIEGGEQLRLEGRAAIADQNYDLAVEKLQAARATFNQVSRYYQDLAGLFLGIDTQVNESNRAKALEAAQLRDETSYDLAVLHRSQGEPNLAVPLLMEVLNSQQPTRPLGQDAYQQLFEMGFVDQPYLVGGSDDS